MISSVVETSDGAAHQIGETVLQGLSARIGLAHDNDAFRIHLEFYPVPRPQAEVVTDRLRGGDLTLHRNGPSVG